MIDCCRVGVFVGFVVEDGGEVVVRGIYVGYELLEFVCFVFENEVG